MGVSRDTFYWVKKAKDSGGRQALRARIDAEPSEEPRG
jgi:hypothetical protein